MLAFNKQDIDFLSGSVSVNGEILEEEYIPEPTYRDFEDFIKRNPDTRITEMDTVLGCEGSRKVLLTFHFNPCEFMMAYLLDSKEAKHDADFLESIG